MSTFNILNNNKEMAIGHSSDENVVQKGMTQEYKSENAAARSATEEMKSAAAATLNNSLLVQRAHILSGTRELKQSNSVLTGHAAD